MQEIESSDFINVPADDVMAGTEAIRLEECDGSTCLAWHSIDREHGGRHLFYKQLRPEKQGDEQCRLLFRKEFDTGTMLDSPYLPRYRSLKETGGGMLMTMDFIEGKTLAQILREDPKSLGEARTLERLMTQLADALVYLHANNVLHLDLKPANIILTQRTGNIKIIDLGFCGTDGWAQSMGRNHAFSAPEQNDGRTEEVSTRSDIYAVGRIIKHIAGQTQTTLPAWLNAIVEKCLQEVPAKRYATAKDLLEALQEHGRNRRLRRRIVWGVVLAAILGTAGYFAHRYYPQIVEHYYDRTHERTFTTHGLHFRVMSFYDATAEVTAPADSLYPFGVVIPDTVHYGGRAYDVVRIGTRAFDHFPNLNSIHLGSKLQSIGDSAFYYCGNLPTINMGDNVRELGVAAFRGCDSVYSIRLSRNLREIPERCFQDDNALLQRIDIPEGVERIGRDAFAGCTHLESISLPKSLRHIDRGVFWECRNLDNVVLPEKLESIGDFCLWFCDKLHSVKVMNPEPVNTTEFLEYVAPDCILYVPKGSLEAYKNTMPWSKYRMEESNE